MELFSNAFFKDHFFYPLLSLCKDSVPNVRLRVCSLLPKLKSQIRLPSDRAMLQELEAVARRVHRYERDPDVLEIIEKVRQIERTRLILFGTYCFHIIR